MTFKKILVIISVLVFAAFGLILLLTANVLRNHGNMALIICAGAFICVFLVAGIVFTGIKTIVKPLKALSYYTKQMAAGESNAPDHQFPLKAALSEVADLRDVFDAMINTFHEKISSVEKHSDKCTRELREINGYVKMLMESASNMFMLVDRKMRIVYCSNSVLDLFGLDDFDKIIGKSISTIQKMYPDEEYAKRSEDRFSRIRLGEEWISEDDVITWSDMSKRSYRVIYRRVSDEKEKFGGVVHILDDVTAVRLEESERRINDILYSTQLPCMIWDGKGNLIAYNDETTSVFGYPDGAYFDDLNTIITDIQPEYQPDGQVSEYIRQEFIKDVFDKGFSRVTAQLRKKDGTPLYFAISAARISWQFEFWLVVYYYDLTDMKAMEAEAREAEERVRIMLDSTPMICILRDENFKALDCNQEALNMFGVSKKTELLENYTGFYPEYQPDGSRSIDKAGDIINSLLERGSVDSFEWIFQTAQGVLFPVESTYVKIQWKDTYRFLTYYRDLREAKANEQKMLESMEQSRMLELQKEAAQAASEAKSQFLANMSHEIRTPMNAVLGMAELLLSENLSKRQFRYVEDIKTSAMALLDIINDILDLSKIQSGKLELVPVHYNFKALIENISTMAYFLVKNKSIVFKMEMKGSVPKFLFGDDVRLRQILLNILGNAIKFTKEGSVSLFVDITDTNIIFVISDTGVGIREKDIPTLFDAFVQADLEKNRDRKGSGLGLSITKALIDMMGGQISLESVYGKGSTFKVTIPKLVGDEAQTSHMDAGDSNFYAPDAKILVVDDNTINLNVIRGLLQLWKINTETTTSGRQAIELLGQKKYDLVFMDHMMPEMDGVETTKRIREQGIDVPIIALTANAVTGVKDFLMAAGMNDFLSKPIIKTSLINMLRNWLPAEKIINPEPDSKIPGKNESDTQGRFWEAVEQIDGLSVDEGLDRVSGQKNVYEKSLRIMLKEIEKCVTNLNLFLASNDMRNFAIEVHSMKGSLANIGVEALSGEALKLETAANQMNTEFCTAALPAFCDKLNALNDKLTDAFSKHVQNSGPIEIPPEMPLIFARLKDAFNAMDFLVINNEMENLDAMQVGGALKEKIELIKDAVLVMNYDDANEVIYELLNNS